MYLLYEFPPSGNCYKIRLILSHLRIQYRRVTKDIVKGETRTPEFLHINPNGRIPVLEIDKETYLAESNAILWYLASGTPYLPADPLNQARILQWMFFEQYSHEPYIATSRYWISTLNAKERYREALEQKKPLGYAALEIMEKHLQQEPFFVNRQYSIADIALYAYTHVAHEGEFDLSPYTAIKQWFARIEALPDYVGISA